MRVEAGDSSGLCQTLGLPLWNETLSLFYQTVPLFFCTFQQVEPHTNEVLQMYKIKDEKY